MSNDKELQQYADEIIEYLVLNLSKAHGNDLLTDTVTEDIPSIGGEGGFLDDFDDHFTSLPFNKNQLDDIINRAESAIANKNYSAEAINRLNAVIEAANTVVTRIGPLL